MRKKKSKFSIVLNIILLIIAVIIIVKLWHIYKLNDFREFTKAELNSGISEFSRDDEIKYSNVYSYKINSNDYNDALIYKNLQIEKNTPYKIKAMVKYEDVQNKNELSNGGVNIGIMDTLEKSESYTGSSDWKEIVFEFDSKERDNVNIAFRLGSNDDNTKGTVWFTNFKIEKGIKKDDSNWNCVLFIMKNMNVDNEENGITKNTNLSLKDEEISLLKENMQRFKEAMKELSRKLNDSYI